MHVYDQNSCARLLTQTNNDMDNRIVENNTKQCLENIKKLNMLWKTETHIYYKKEQSYNAVENGTTKQCCGKPPKTMLQQKEQPNNGIENKKHLLFVRGRWAQLMELFLGH